MSTLWSSIRIWADMVKVAHTIFAMPFALMATCLAGRHLDERNWPHAGQIVLIVWCMVAARSAAMTFNRIADAEIDARNPRTAQRALPARRLSGRAAWIMLMLWAVTFVAGCLGFWIWYGNRWPAILSAPVLGYLCGYSYAKRFTKWSHFYLGTAIAISPVAAWLAIHPASLGMPAWLMLATVALWIAGFDIIYACQDIEIDRREGLFSLPSRLGPSPALWIARACHTLVVIGLIGVGTSAGLGHWYFAGVVCVVLLLVIEHALVKPGDYRHVNMAFFTINGIVSVLLAVATIVDLALAY